jgi:hypothetical protein
MFEAKFQTFEERAARADTAARLAALRAELKRRGLDAVKTAHLVSSTQECSLPEWELAPRT